MRLTELGTIPPFVFKTEGIPYTMRLPLRIMTLS